MTTSPDLQELVADLRTMIQADASSDPAARAMAVIVLELAAATIFNLQRVADAVEAFATPVKKVEVYVESLGHSVMVEESELHR